MTHPRHAATSSPEAPKRMTLSAVVEHLLNRGSSQSSSVTLTRNAKGETQIEVVVRTDAELDIVTPDDARKTAEQVYDALRTKYPLVTAPSSSGGAS
jgi:hypothetical protein